MLRPPTTMRSARSARRWYAASTSPVQSAQRVVSMSSTVVPWPGRRGSSTWKPAPATASASPRIDDGLPVKPWSASTPGAAVVAWRCATRARRRAGGSTSSRRSTAWRAWHPYSSAWWADAAARSRRRRSPRSARCSSSPRSACSPCFSSGSSCGLVWDVPFWWFAVGYMAAGVLLFIRPIQAFVLTPLFGARRPTDAELRADRTRSGGTSPAPTSCRRTATSSACCRPTSSTPSPAAGTSSSSRRSPSPSCPRRELAGVLAHELSHHLGLHTVGLTIGHWLSLPVVLLARVGFLLQNVATAATQRVRLAARPGWTMLGQLVAGLLNVLRCRSSPRLYAADALGNVVAHRAEFQADRRVVRMGYGRNLAARAPPGDQPRRRPAPDRLAGPPRRVAPAGAHPRRPHRRACSATRRRR